MYIDRLLIGVRLYEQFVFLRQVQLIQTNPIVVSCSRKNCAKSAITMLSPVVQHDGVSSDLSNVEQVVWLSPFHQ